MQTYLSRIAQLQNQVESSDVDAVVVSPGPDLLYLTGYDAIPLERLTALVVRKGAAPFLVSPLLERAAAAASPFGSLNLEIRTWTETESPYQLIASELADIEKFAVDGRMWAEKLIRMQQAISGAKAVSATPLISQLRMRKTQSEVEALREAGAAIDWVHSQVADLLKPGRTEAEVGADIAKLIRDSGHSTVDFVIVGSGPNSASPHHELSDRVIRMNEPIVVDLGGTMPSGYCSDSTRTYFVGTPDAEYLERYEILLDAQQLATAAVQPGIPCEEIDAVARRHMTANGIGELFIHRIGHGIGMETHEDPYMVAGNSLPLELGFAFSIEPGFYEDGKAGARIEDIVVCGEAGAIVLNNRPRELHVIN
ncbi:MAG: hypothetical protein RL038_574 [Actinomycetota bacterium]|jgi:Xaa-Pro aminopeptidase